MVSPSSRQRRVLVVGGGVSGCACAAALAAAGIRVQVVSPALDAVGLPSYGPDLVPEGGGVEGIAAILESLPSPLREAWRAATRLALPGKGDGPGCGLSVETGFEARGAAEAGAGSEMAGAGKARGDAGDAAAGHEVADVWRGDGRITGRDGGGDEVAGRAAASKWGAGRDQVGRGTSGGGALGGDARGHETLDRETGGLGSVGHGTVNLSRLDHGTRRGLGLFRGFSTSSGYLNVDRRLLSVQTKRMLESMEGLEFRQGLVEDFWIEQDPGREPGPRVSVRTVFGEILQADVLVIATGVSLGGEVAIGEDRLKGGRYGEMSADGLLEALRRHGVLVKETSLQVGARLPCGQEVWEYLPSWGRKAAVSEWVSQGVEDCAQPGRYRGAARELERMRLLPVEFRPVAQQGEQGWDQVPTADRRASLEWPLEYPPTPYQDTSPVSWGLAIVSSCEEERGAGPCGWRGVVGAEAESAEAESAKEESAKEESAKEETAKAGVRLNPDLPGSETSRRCLGVVRSGFDTRVGGSAETLGDASLGGRGEGSLDRSGRYEASTAWPVVSPDGLATGEVYIDPAGGRAAGLLAVSAEGRGRAEVRRVCEGDPKESAAASRARGPGEVGEPSRLGYVVRGWIIESVDEDGRVVTQGKPMGPVWVVGRAGGARSYLQSLASGTGVARCITEYLGARPDGTSKGLGGHGVVEDGLEPDEAGPNLWV